MLPNDVAEQITAANAARDFATVAELINRAPLEAWFGLAPEQFVPILMSLPAEDVAGRAAVRGMRATIAAAIDPAAAAEAGLDLQSMTDRDDAAGTLAAVIFGLRVRGEVRRAAHAGSEYADLLRRPNALFDHTFGNHTFLALQRGISSALVGEDREALGFFAAAQRTTPPPALMALVRDAYVKSALIEALHGDPDVARRQLETAETVPRTTSWVEGVADAHADIARAMIADDPVSGVEMIERVPGAAVGEFWPFLVEATCRLYLRAGRAADLGPFLQRSATAAPQHHAGQGLPGSIIELFTAVSSLVRGDLPAARVALAPTDSEMPLTVLIKAAVDIASGRASAAATRLAGLHERTAGLRQVESARAALLAWALLRSDAEPAAVEILARWIDGRRDPSEIDLEYFPTDVRALGAASVVGWPARGAPRKRPSTWHLAQPVNLTSQEQRVLVLLSTDKTRAQIADELFVSPNTVKSHARSLFRKLGVDNRGDAVITAHRWGLL